MSPFRHENNKLSNYVFYWQTFAGELVVFNLPAVLCLLYFYSRHYFSIFFSFSVDDDWSMASEISLTVTIITSNTLWLIHAGSPHVSYSA